MGQQQWSKLPLEIRELMLKRQYEQCGIKDSTVFETAISASKSGRGFDWYLTVEGEEFWDSIISYGYLDKFYSMYGSVIKSEYKKEYRKVFKVNKIPTEKTEELLSNLKKHNLEHILW